MSERTDLGYLNDLGVDHGFDVALRGYDRRQVDDYLQPPEARERFARVPQAEVIGVDGAKHLWVGDAETVLDLVVSRVAPSRSPLPQEWDGPMESADSSAYADRTVAAFSTSVSRCSAPWPTR